MFNAGIVVVIEIKMILCKLIVLSFFYSEVVMFFCAEIFP